VVAEKLQAILSRGIISSRMRDYYDCYMLERMYGGEINTKKLKSAIAYTTLPTNTSEVLTSVSKSEQMAQMWERYQKTNSYEAKINFIETIESVRSLLKIAEVLK
jgi:predicted nucleotidyltransferase component of viral defense system